MSHSFIRKMMPSSWQDPERANLVGENLKKMMWRFKTLEKNVSKIIILNMDPDSNNQKDLVDALETVISNQLGELARRALFPRLKF